ncbi:MAG: hypothetical protein FJY11_03855 [Bacteroidetes bacterium]|nr:hypothetical protein [Bacteroidota bacterium]
MKNIIYWFLAVVITISAAIYQRSTGPTYPMRAEVNVNGEVYRIKLVRSLGLDERPSVRLAIFDETASAKLFYKRFRTDDPYMETDFIFGMDEMKGFFAAVPPQPPAGKLQYYIEITDSGGTQTLFREAPVVIRFKGAVPGWALTPHILLMFFAMLFSTAAGLMAAFGNESQRRYGIVTLVLLLAGGMILGPVVQYYAFGEFWTGVPFGWDLTDNKTLVSVLFWVLAVVMNYRRKKPAYTIIAAAVLLLVYSIPHSMFGSELDFATGEIKQAMLPFISTM